MKAQTISMTALPLAAANTEYTVTIPPGTQRFELFVNTAAAALRVSTVPGVVASSTAPFRQVAAGVSWYEDNIDLQKPITLYIATTTASTAAVLQVWS